MTQSWDAPPEMQIDSGKSYSCTLETSKGAIDLDLYPEHAPKTRLL
jgi:peptidyl-prolyl cis-trans isomerase B (cyclophilin B)